MTEPGQHPSAGQIGVALEALHAEARRWQPSADQFADFARDVPMLGLIPLHGFPDLLTDFIPAYNDAVGLFAERCRQGSTAFAEIAQRLESVAAIYAAEEAANLHALNDLY